MNGRRFVRLPPKARDCPVDDFVVGTRLVHDSGREVLVTQCGFINLGPDAGTVHEGMFYGHPAVEYRVTRVDNLAPGTVFEDSRGDLWERRPGLYDDQDGAEVYAVGLNDPTARMFSASREIRLVDPHTLVME